MAEQLVVSVLVDVGNDPLVRRRLRRGLVWVRCFCNAWKREELEEGAGEGEERVYILHVLPPSFSFAWLSAGDWVYGMVVKTRGRLTTVSLHVHANILFYMIWESTNKYRVSSEPQ